MEVLNVVVSASGQSKWDNMLSNRYMESSVASRPIWLVYIIKLNIISTHRIFETLGLRCCWYFLIKSFCFLKLTHTHQVFQAQHQVFPKCDLRRRGNTFMKHIFGSETSRSTYSVVYRHIHFTKNSEDCFIGLGALFLFTYALQSITIPAMAK